MSPATDPITMEDLNPDPSRRFTSMGHAFNADTLLHALGQCTGSPRCPITRNTFTPEEVAALESAAQAPAGRLAALQTETRHARITAETQQNMYHQLAEGATGLVGALDAALQSRGPMRHPPPLLLNAEADVASLRLARADAHRQAQRAVSLFLPRYCFAVQHVVKFAADRVGEFEADVAGLLQRGTADPEDHHNMEALLSQAMVDARGDVGATCFTVAESVALADTTTDLPDAAMHMHRTQLLRIVSPGSVEEMPAASAVSAAEFFRRAAGPSRGRRRLVIRNNPMYGSRRTAPPPPPPPPPLPPGPPPEPPPLATRVAPRGGGE